MYAVCLLYTYYDQIIYIVYTAGLVPYTHTLKTDGPKVFQFNDKRRTIKLRISWVGLSRSGEDPASTTRLT